MTFRRLQRTESSLSFEQNTVKVVGRDGKMMDDQTNVKKKKEYNYKRKVTFSALCRLFLVKLNLFSLEFYTHIFYSGIGAGCARHKEQSLCWHDPGSHQSWVGTAGTAAPRHLLIDSYQFHVRCLASWLNLHPQNTLLALKSAWTHSPTDWLCLGAANCSQAGKGCRSLLSVSGS